MHIIIHTHLHVRAYFLVIKKTKLIPVLTNTHVLLTCKTYTTHTHKHTRTQTHTHTLTNMHTICTHSRVCMRERE